MAAELTISCIKADVGGFVGHSAIHPALKDEAGRQLEVARRHGLLLDFHVTACGDDLGLLMTHRLGIDSHEIHRLAWDVFDICTRVAKELKLYGAGQDL
ncbi:fructose 1,6-bisphosphatase, partial [Roseiflexus sp.]|uniref:fructose 1,6-bisphosphatase n=1 Tax=Roseiflexus sp. TaxID=2562120 RepID=UPI00398BB8DC